MKLDYTWLLHSMIHSWLILDVLYNLTALGCHFAARLSSVEFHLELTSWGGNEEGDALDGEALTLEELDHLELEVLEGTPLVDVKVRTCWWLMSLETKGGNAPLNMWVVEIGKFQFIAAEFLERAWCFLNFRVHSSNPNVPFRSMSGTANEAGKNPVPVGFWFSCQKRWLSTFAAGWTGHDLIGHAARETDSR